MSSPIDDIDLTEITEIDAEKLKRMQTQHVRFWLLDLRDASAYEAGHIPGAFHIPAADFATKIPQMVPSKEMPMVIYDQDGVASRRVCVAAGKMGYLNIVNLEGGFGAFKKL